MILSINEVLAIISVVQLGADHLIPGGGLWFFCEKKILQQILENKKSVQLLVVKK